jgi:hypothetical protein
VLMRCDCRHDQCRASRRRQTLETWFHNVDMLR